MCAPPGLFRRSYPSAMASWTRRLLEETDSDASKADLSASCGRSERMYRYVLPTLARPSRGLRSDIASYRFSRSPKFSCVIASLSSHIIALGVVLSKAVSYTHLRAHETR